MKAKRFNLKQGLAYWQKALRLLDWDIEAIYIDHLDEQGSNDIDAHLKTSLVKISRSLETKPSDAEVTLVHELVHIPLDFVRINMRPEGLKHMLLEQAVEGLAQTLVELRRGPAR